MAALEDVERLLLKQHLLKLREVTGQTRRLMVGDDRDFVRESLGYIFRALGSLNAVRRELCELRVVNGMKAAVRNRLIAVVALAVAGGGLAFIAFGNLGQNLVFYWSPAEMLSKGDFTYGPTIRLGGIVKAGSIEWEAQHTRLQFRIADNKEPNAPSVLVSSTEVPPQMFREGIGVVVEGTMTRNGYFEGNRLMVKHGNDYQAPKNGQRVDSRMLIKSTKGFASGGRP